MSTREEFRSWSKRPQLASLAKKDHDSEAKWGPAPPTEHVRNREHHRFRADLCLTRRHRGGACSHCAGRGPAPDDSDTCTSPFTESFSYDEDGNLTLDRQFLYTWDAENRLIRVETRIDWGQNSSAYDVGDKRVYFSYDYMGRRVRKRVETYDGSSWPETSDELFIYDGWNPVLVLNANANNAVTRKYTWGLDLSNTLHGAGGIGGLLACVETQGTETELDDERYWFFADANGNVTRVVDATDTEDLYDAATYEHDAYGNVTASTGYYAAVNPFRFSSKWFDAETGLGNWTFRYYSPRLGRWISRDPIGEGGGLNVYAFVENVPTQAIDPLGEVGSWEPRRPPPRAWEPRNCGDCWQTCLSNQDKLTGVGAVLCRGDGCKCACVKMSSFNPGGDYADKAIYKCAIRHEEVHTSQGSCDVLCWPWSVYEMSQYPWNQKDNECQAYADTVNCLRDALPGCQGNKDCQDKLNRWIDNAERQCAKLGGDVYQYGARR